MNLIIHFGIILHPLYGSLGLALALIAPRKLHMPQNSYIRNGDYHTADGEWSQSR